MTHTGLIRHRRFPLPIIMVALGAIGYSAMLLCADDSPSRSLNAGLPASFDPAPNYRLCTDEGDIWQLSDGTARGRRSSFEGTAADLPEMLPGMTGEERARISLWGNKSSVGWVRPRTPILITFDLKKKERIGSIRVSSAAGASGVYWPTAIGIAVSPDGERWSYAGDLIARSRKHGLPPPMGYSTHLFRVDDLNVEGRYVALCVFPGSTSMFFTDEIEIRAGDAAQPPARIPEIGTVDQLREYVQTHTVPNLILRRLALDSALIGTAIAKADLAADQKSRLQARLAALGPACNEVPSDLPAKLRTILPMLPAQEQLLALYGELLREQGYPPLLATKAHRNAYLGWLTAPAQKTQTPVELNFRQMRNETRSDLFLLTNATPEARTVALTSDDATGLTLFYCPWTDTPQLEPVATALLPAAPRGKGWEVEIPAGLTMKIYVTADASILPPGRQQRRLSVRGAGEAIEVGLRFDISQIAMGPERLHLGMWDYTNNQGYDSLTPANREAAIRLMRSHGVDSPWATRRVTPFPKAEDYDREDNLHRFPDYEELDRWIARWPGARRYMIFVNVGDSIAGVPSDSPRFAKRVAQWAEHLADHVARLGLQPGQLHLCFVDEPNTDQKEKRVAAWAAPVKEAAPTLTIWSNPVSQKPADSPNHDAFGLPHVLCPDLGVLRKGGEAAWTFYQNHGRNGKGLEVYLCSAIAPHTDPNRYFRLLAMAGWRLRIQGIGFWSFHGQGGLADAFAAYGPTKNAIWYSPAFLHDTDATDTLQWQAVRESLLDYEYLRAVEKRLPSITDEAARKKALALISDDAINALIDTRKTSSGIAWNESANWDAPDHLRIKILDLLESLGAEHGD